MFVIGLTGSLATGKSTVAALLKKKGAQAISADAIVHELMQPRGACFAPIVKMFGRGILNGDGKIDRQQVASIVFKNKKKLKKLEAIIHPEVRKQILRVLNRNGGSHTRVVLEIPLLFEAGFDKIVDASVVVFTTPETQFKRAIGLGMTQAEAAQRIKAQMPLRKKIRLADFIIDNNGTKKQTEKQVNALWQRL